ncbi:MAG: eukaryotic-like serine/threonine-protein kinase [Blastocatellia bacterium]|jgi:serine/threonine-protein kinase|nr:eukaryotic-like serine/threonine-protein kinase [Blastocatellia bacterium]
MKSCPNCGKEYADTTTLCPSDGAVLQQTGDELIGQTLAGKYRIEELISEGGMGAVYRGIHVLMDKKVAVKVLRPSLAADDTIVARFSREAKAASRIAHPHALSVTDFGESENGVVFLVMEYLDGETLKNVIRNDGPMPLARVVEIMRQVGGALDAAHAEGVIHRDLKSDNIMLMEANGGDWAKVLDFGIAKIKERTGSYDPGITAPNLIIGTPQYMSPEQCSQSSELDSRSDNYSLGVILYEMLIGHVPFTGESPTAIMMKHLQEPPPSVLEERDDLPASVGRVVARALAKRPGDRYQSAGDLVDALIKAASDQAPLAAAAGVTTDRILVPTSPNSPAMNTAADQDEVTVVRQRPLEHAPVTTPVAPVESAPAPDFNPWRIVIPSLAALVLVFTGIFIFTRNSGQTPATPADSQLTADPNSQPVQSAQPATGQAEEGIRANAPAAVPSVTATPLSAAPTPDISNTNTQANENTAPPANTNTNTARELPSPKVPANNNSGVPLPTPGGKPSPKEPDPLPKPTQTKPAPPPGDGTSPPAY